MREEAHALYESRSQQHRRRVTQPVGGAIHQPPALCVGCPQLCTVLIILKSTALC